MWNFGFFLIFLESPDVPEEQFIQVADVSLSPLIIIFEGFRYVGPLRSPEYFSDKEADHA